MTVEEEQHEKPKEPNTAFAAALAVFMVIPGYMVASILTVIYAFFFRIFTAGGSWIPYVDEIGNLWFPEMLRGIATGAIAIFASRHFFPASNLEAVRLATFAFWGALILLLFGLSIFVNGLALQLIAGVALLIGFGIGIWMTD